jgi:hypothetical protein
MEIIKFNGDPVTELQDGEIVNGLRRKTWIERYREAGEFTFVGEVNSGLRDILSIGSIVSHTETPEIMIVENHEISEEPDEDPELIITGRSFETYFNERIVGSNQSYPSSGGLTEYTLASDDSGEQVKDLIEDHILAANLVDDDDALSYVVVSTDLPNTYTQSARTIARGPLYSRVLELLEVDDLGIRSLRPHQFAPGGSAGDDIRVVIHDGNDLTDSVFLSYFTGAIEKADYLWSNKGLKNCAYVHGKWVDTLVDSSATGYDRRMMLVDASDLDEAYSSAPSGGTRTAIVTAMQVRGAQALAAQRTTALIKAEQCASVTRACYRRRFDIGDVVTVLGNFGEEAAMRISEYVEIEDEEGYNGYPTLAVI